LCYVFLSMLLYFALFGVITVSASEFFEEFIKANFSDSWKI
jgi:hypothetical protein